MFRFTRFLSLAVLIAGFVVAESSSAFGVATLDGATLRVEVVDRDGQGLDDVLVLLSRQDGELRRKASTDGAGRAEFAHLSAGGYWLSARGYSEALRVVVDGGGDQTARLEVASPSLSEAGDGYRFAKR